MRGEAKRLGLCSLHDLGGGSKCTCIEVTHISKERVRVVLTPPHDPGGDVLGSREEAAFTSGFHRGYDQAMLDARTKLGILEDKP